eukprot:2918658-Rhodomonas_salina.2
MKGARQYHKTKCQRWQEAKTKALQRGDRTKLLAASSILCPPSELPEPPAATKCRTRFATCTKHVSTLSSDDFLQAFGARTAGKISCLALSYVTATQPQLTLHIDHAHAIALGYCNEGFYLILVVDGFDFLWAEPSVS